MTGIFLRLYDKIGNNFLNQKTSYHNSVENYFKNKLKFEVFFVTYHFRNVQTLVLLEAKFDENYCAVFNQKIFYCNI